MTKHFQSENRFTVCKIHSLMKRGIQESNEQRNYNYNWPTNLQIVFVHNIRQTKCSSYFWTNGQTVYIWITVSQHHIYLALILKNSDYGLSWIMQNTQCTNTYQFHFFVLPMIFMPNPTTLYLCSQLASVTKGLCKQLLQANRFLPTSEETASYAAPICPPGMHKNMSAISIFFSHFAFQRKMERKEESEKQENKQNTDVLMHKPFCIIRWL